MLSIGNTNDHLIASPKYSNSIFQSALFGIVMSDVLFTTYDAITAVKNMIQFTCVQYCTMLYANKKPAERILNVEFIVYNL